MSTHRGLSGSSIMEYVIPVALIGIGVGTCIYTLSTNGNFLNNIMFSSAGKVDTGGGKISVGTGASVNGIYLGTDNKVYVSNAAGKQVRVPLSFYNNYKKGLQDYLKEGKFDTSTSGSNLGEETSGAVGIEDISSAQGSSTLIYSSMIEMTSKAIDDNEAADLLEKMSKYGNKMGQLEVELIEVKKTMFTFHNAYEAKAKSFWETQKEYEKAQKKYENNDSSDNYNTMKLAMAQMENSANQYMIAKENFKNSSNKFLSQATGYFNELKNETGQSYDSILSEIEANTEIDQDTKDMVLPIGKKIKDVKDSVDIIEEMVDAFNLEFNKITHSYEEFTDNFRTFQILIDENAGDETFDALDEAFLEENPDFNINNDQTNTGQ